MLTASCIPLSRGLVTLVDAEDYEALARHKWCVSTYGYAIRNRSRKQGRGIVWMHREILKAPPGLSVDHVSMDKLDNRKANLRLVTHQQNHFNVLPRKNTSSCYKGVYWESARSKWCAQATIQRGDKQHHLFIGRYDTEIEAAVAYDNLARVLHGEHARLNFPNGVPNG